MSRRYQKEYADSRSQMYDSASRIEKAKHIVSTLTHYFGKRQLKNKLVVDVGASTGIIDDYVSTYVKKLIGTDIDEGAIKHARKVFKRKNLIFKYDDAMKLSFKNNSVDVVICTHVYEHVPNAQKLFSEIYRVLKPGGICYLAAINALWPIEPHYDLPFLSYLPKRLANIYIRIKGKKEYYETPVTYWGLMKLTHKFEQIDYTAKILNEPKVFGYSNPIFTYIPSDFFQLISPLAKYISPTSFWILKKHE